MTEPTRKPAAMQAPEQIAAEDARLRRSRLSQSFNRAAQTLDEATDSARSMATALERKGLLLRVPPVR